jgi:hypothetical protein
MDNLRYIIRQAFSEAFKRKHYTTWKKLVDESRKDIDETVADIVEKVTAQLGISKYSPAGRGSQGYAYYIPNNRVLKITTDRSEAVESKKIKGKKCKHLANIYEVYTLKGKYEGVYVIICELLQKDEKIDNADNAITKAFKPSSMSFFYNYQKGDYDKETVMFYIEKVIKSDFKIEVDPDVLRWYVNGMLGIIDELKANNISTHDYNPVNLGIKKDGNLAMHDFGYSPNTTDDDTNILHIDELKKQVSEYDTISQVDYPDFLDPQYNKGMKNTPYPPTQNPNKSPMREVNISPEELDKKNLPLKHHNLWSEFLTANKNALSDILPTLKRQYSNVETLQTVKDIRKYNPALYDQFADWIYKLIQ